MSDRTGIQWTQATWNPVVGCSKVSPGCDHCYAIRDGARLQHTPAYAGTVADGDWTGVVRWLPERLDQPLRWRRPRRIFVNSMSDLFHDSVPDGFIAAVWFVMGQCAGCIPEQYRGHVFQILTKRPGRMASWLRRWADVGDPQIPPMDPAAQQCGRAELIAEAAELLGEPIMYDWMDGPRYWPAELPNVWLGTSVEDQRWADVRVPKLLEAPAAVRFLSCEPLLGPIQLKDDWVELELQAFGANGAKAFPRVDWCIVGGESGPGARPMHPDWTRSLRDQCQAADVAFFLKQWGEWLPVREVYDQAVSETGDDPLDAYDLSETTSLNINGTREQGWTAGAGASWGQQPDPSRSPWWMARVGKKHAGRELDGRTWDEYPGQPLEVGDPT